MLNVSALAEVVDRASKLFASPSENVEREPVGSSDPHPYERLSLIHI